MGVGVGVHEHAFFMIALFLSGYFHFSIVLKEKILVVISAL